MPEATKHDAPKSHDDTDDKAEAKKSPKQSVEERLDAIEFVLRADLDRLQATKAAVENDEANQS